MRHWLIWDSKRWAISESGQVYKLAKETIATFLMQALQHSNQGAERFAKQSLDHKRIITMLASAECELPVKPADLDRHPHLLTCLNLKNEIREHCSVLIR
jgi:hypothetical protein